MNMMYGSDTDGNGTMVRDLVLPGNNLIHVEITNGYAGLFGGIWKGNPRAVYAFRRLSTDDRGTRSPMIPVYVVDGKDTRGMPVYSTISTTSDEFKMFGELAQKHRIFNGMRKSPHHQMLSRRQLRRRLPVNPDAPLLDLYRWC